VDVERDSFGAIDEPRVLARRRRQGHLIEVLEAAEIGMGVRRGAAEQQHRRAGERRVDEAD
jgi:hypothetical protein